MRVAEGHGRDRCVYRSCTLQLQLTIQEVVLPRGKVTKR